MNKMAVRFRGLPHSCSESLHFPQQNALKSTGKCKFTGKSPTVLRRQPKQSIPVNEELKRGTDFPKAAGVVILSCSTIPANCGH
jgi:hypothetical protein